MFWEVHLDIFGVSGNKLGMGGGAFGYMGVVKQHEYFWKFFGSNSRVFWQHF
jgi:hypothetical protein